MKQHYYIQGTSMYLKTTFRKLQELSSVYDGLSSGYMYEWFYPNGEIKPNHKRCVKLDTYFAKSKQHCSILVDHPLFEEGICKILRTNLHSK